MSLATVISRSVKGIEAPLVTIEAHLSGGLPSLSIVGLPETTVKESKDRVRSAILNSGFQFPASRITINLAPADLPKEGGRFDLGIAISILAASKQLFCADLQSYEFTGELGLDGRLRPVRGALPIALQASKAGRKLFVPIENAEEAGLAEGISLLTPSHLLAACAHLSGAESLAPYRSRLPDLPRQDSGPDLTEVRGQLHAKRALEVAAAGGHNLLMIGPPGGGKTMLANRLASILPEMTKTEAIESAAIHSVSHGGFSVEQWRTRPFRSPHHTSSSVALAGGGAIPRPGEISLAHQGVLFLDELPEFDRHALEVLREPLESGEVHISRAAQHITFPARFQLIAAMNPCPCGYLGDSRGRCHCSEDHVRRYRSRISGPLLDRIDMHIELPAVPFSVISPNPGGDPSESSAAVKLRVGKAREIQLARYGTAINSRLNARQIEICCPLNAAGTQLMERAMQRLGLSARAYHRILRVARTIADLAQHTDLATEHLMEAIQYRKLDRA